MGKRLTVKDSLFKKLFGSPEYKENALSLYNALNHSHYSDPDALEFTTIENFFFMSIRNDVSFLLSDVLSLYEHQSTYNPNMPVRGLFYFSEHYQKLIQTRPRGKREIYGRKIIKLPTPRYVVLYNGSEERPEREILKLSSAFIHQDQDPYLECKVLMLNINSGKNRELLAACRPLEEYSIFVEKCREYVKIYSESKAVQMTISYCRENNILTEFLNEHEMEAYSMDLFRQMTLEEEMQIRLANAADEGFEEGFERGEKAGFKQGEQAGFRQGEQAGFKQGEQAGFKQGEQAGFDKGRAEGIEKGRAEGIEKGRAEGIEKGRAEGIEKGRTEGIEKGRAEGIESIKEDYYRVLKETFPSLSDEEIQKRINDLFTESV